MRWIVICTSAISTSFKHVAEALHQLSLVGIENLREQVGATQGSGQLGGFFNNQESSL
jgi:hypothetical protein